MTNCISCGFFEAEPKAIERGMPLLAALSSANASVRVDDGLCKHHDRYVLARAYCSAHLGKGGVLP